jgi:hypothetical protein
MVVVPILPKNRPCEQCGKPIRAPTWMEADQDWIHFVWDCTGCDFQFRTTAIYDLLQRRWLEN